MSRTTKKPRRRAAGEGSIYQRADGRWEAVLNLGYRAGGTRHRRKAIAPTMAAAAARLEQLKLEAGLGLDVASERWTITYWLEQWLITEVRPTLRPRTYEQYASVCRGHLIPALGHKRLRALTPTDVRAYLQAKLGTNLSARTVGNHHIVLRRALEIAYRYGYVEKNVARLVSAPRATRYRSEPLTIAEMKRFLAASRGHPREALFVLLGATGMRIGEALGLTWKHVDLESGTARIEQALHRTPVAVRGEGGSMFALGEPKTEKSRRTLALPAAAVAVLKAHRAREAERRLAAPVWLNEWDLVFTGDQGTPLSDRAVRYEFHDLLKQAGITGRRVRLHDLRHGAATYMLAQGVPMKVVQEVLGHSQMSITSDTYSHVMPELQREAADRLGAVLFGGSAGESTA